jgi:hypothetical protein
MESGRSQQSNSFSTDIQYVAHFALAQNHTGNAMRSCRGNARRIIGWRLPIDQVVKHICGPPR